MKNNLIKCLLSICFFFILLIISNTVYASYSIENMDMQVTVLDNGDVEVNQVLEYKFVGEYNGIYISIPYILDDAQYDKVRKDNNTILNDSLYNNSGAEILSVSEISKNDKKEFKKVNSSYNGSKEVYTETKESGNLLLKVYSPSVDISKKFDIKYILKDTCVRHIDTAELYYNFIGGSWETEIKKLNIDIHIPNNLDKENLYIFAHGPQNGNSTIISSKHINLKVDNVKKGQYVAARVLFGIGNIPNCTKSSVVEAKGVIFETEEGILNELAKKDRINNIIIMIIIVLLVYWFILLFKYEYDKKYLLTEINEEELYEKFNPLLAGCIEGSRNILSRDIIAVLLNLINKKIIDLEIKNTLDSDDLYEYILTKKQIVENENDLDEIEKYICDWFFGNSEKMDIVKRLKELPSDKKAKEKFEELDKKATKLLNSIGANKSKVPMILRVFNVILFIGSIVLVIGNSIYNMNLLDLGIFEIIPIILIFSAGFLPMLLYLLYIPLSIIMFTRKQISKIVQRYNGQKIVNTTITVTVLFAILIILTSIFLPYKFLIVSEILLCVTTIIMLTDNLMLKNDISIIEYSSKLKTLKNRLAWTLIDEKNFEHIVLWERYLTYGVSFGVSKKIMGRIAYMPLDKDLMNLYMNKEFCGYINNDYYYFYNRSKLSGKFMETYSKSVKSVSSNFGSSGSGGGFSGGGGYSGRWGQRRRPVEHSKTIIYI